MCSQHVQCAGNLWVSERWKVKQMDSRFILGGLAMAWFCLLQSFKQAFQTQWKKKKIKTPFPFDLRKLWFFPLLSWCRLFICKVTLPPANHVYRMFSKLNYSMGSVERLYPNSTSKLVAWENSDRHESNKNSQHILSERPLVVEGAEIKETLPN